MKVKTFHALTMHDAIRAIKEELGPDAIILSSKEVQQGGRLLRLFNKPVLEVMAAAEELQLESSQWTRPTAPPKPSAAPSAALDDRPAAAVSPFQDTLKSLLQPVVSVAPSPADTPAPAPAAAATPAVSWKAQRLRQLRHELHEVGRLLGASLPPEVQSLGGRLSDAVATCCRSLVTQGIRPSTAESLGRELHTILEARPSGSHEAVQEGMRTLLKQRIRVSGPLLAGQGDRTVSLLLGPSGSGKTTAIAKLAAHYRLEEKKSVAIVTFDTYRQASVEQLRMYANVLGVPFASALSARQVFEGLRRQSQAELVLIDLPGAGTEEVAAAQELHERLKEEAAMDIHLVVPASMREQDLFRLYQRVNALPLLRLFFTKLDETASFGSLFEMTYQTGAPLSYWSAGQRVPEDLEIATPERLAAFLLAQHYVAPSFDGAHDRQPHSTEPQPAEAVAAQNER